MGLRGKVLRNATYLTVGDKIGYVMQFIFFLYFAKQFGVVPVGEYSFAFFLTYALAMFADSGVTIYLVREVARGSVSDRQLFFDCLVLRASSLFTVFVLASTSIFLFFNDIPMQKLNVIAAWGIYWIFYQLADVFLAELNGHEKMGWVALLGIWLKLISSVTGVALIYLGLDYDIVLLAFPASSFIYLCSCLVVSNYTLGPFHIKFKAFSYYKDLIVELVPFLLSVILLEILLCQDILILGFIQDDQSVGLYSSAVKIVTFIYGVQAFIHVAIFPVLSRLFVESRAKLIDVSKKMLRYMVMSSLPLSFGLIITADKIIDLLYPDSFQESSIVLKISSWVIAAGFIQVIFSVLLTAINRQKEKVIFIGLNFAVTTILNVFFIYYFNYVGAAVVKVITAVLGLVFFSYLVSKYLTTLSVLSYAVRPVIACLIMLLFGYYFNNLNLMYLIPVSGFIYFITLLVLGEFTKEEIQYMKKFIPKMLYGQ